MNRNHEWTYDEAMIHKLGHEEGYLSGLLAALEECEEEIRELEADPAAMPGEAAAAHLCAMRIKRLIEAWKGADDDRL